MIFDVRGFFYYLGQYRIILSADTASEVPQPPKRCLSRKAGIVRRCLRSPHDWRYYAQYLIFIEFTSRFAGKVYPYARIKQRKYRKSPEDLTKSVRFSGLFFLSGKCIQKGYTRQQEKSRKDVSIWQIPYFTTVCNGKISEQHFILFVNQMPTDLWFSP